MTFTNKKWNGNARQLQKGWQGHVASLATLSSVVLKRQRQITVPHKPKNIPPHPPLTLERERETGRNNLLFRVLSEERQGCMLSYLCQCEHCYSFSELFCSAAEPQPSSRRHRLSRVCPILRLMRGFSFCFDSHGNWINTETIRSVYKTQSERRWA